MSVHSFIHSFVSGSKAYKQKNKGQTDRPNDIMSTKQKYSGLQWTYLHQA